MSTPSIRGSVAIVDCVLHVKSMIAAATGEVLRGERLGATFRWQTFTIGANERHGLHCVLDEELPLYDGRNLTCCHHIYIYIYIHPPCPALSCPHQPARPAHPTPGPMGWGGDIFTIGIERPSFWGRV